MMKLFAIYVGGEIAGANIEVHDMRFVAAPTIEDSYASLRRQWWGRPSSLHIDCWAEIDHADGYDVTLSDQPFAGPERLFYVNLGGYDGVQFTELHRNMFVVAETLPQAKARALGMVDGWTDLHRDDIYEAEQAFSLDEAVAGERLHIQLTKAAEARPFRFTCHYTPIKAPKADPARRAVTPY